MSAEHARSRRGLWASFTNAGAPFGMVLSTAALTGTGAAVGEEAFLAWGWRVPFLLSVVLLAVGLFVRLRVQETPVFAAARAGSGAGRGTEGGEGAEAGKAAEAGEGREAGEIRADGADGADGARLPLLDVLRHHPRSLLLAVAVGLAAFVAQGTLTTYLIAHGVQAGHPRQTVLNALTLSSALAVPGIIGFSALSDRLGRRPVVLAGAVAMGVFAFALFPMTDAGSPLLLTVALVLGQSVFHPMMYGPLAALYAELFSTRSRYTGASLGYQLAGLGAGLAPLLFAEIQRASGGGATLSVSSVVAGFCALTVVSVLLLGETRDTDLYGAQPSPRPGRLAAGSDSPPLARS
ncbi:MFS transporter [Streptomyces sp. HNM0575]|uniref:MFS transporter n=1 Tax=Streptomyces sp. HNM0575 TaxID=2716338 RepID=UPI0019D1277E